jgi:hypothetical protein
MISFLAEDEYSKIVFATSELSGYETNIHLGELRHHEALEVLK